MLLQAFAKCSQLSNISQLHVFDEPHKKYDKETGHRARHKHFIFKFVRPFAHVRVGHLLAQGGVHGHFSFDSVGYQAYLKYCLVASAHNLAADLDKDPWHWPSHVTTPQLMQVCQQYSAVRTADGSSQWPTWKEANVDDIFRYYGCICRTFCANLHGLLAT